MEEYVDAIRAASTDPARSRNTFQTLLRVLSNVVSNPQEPKYRKLKKSSVAFQRDLLSTPVERVLLHCGFKESTELWELPQDASVDTVSEAAELLECLVESMRDEALTTEQQEEADRTLAMELDREDERKEVEFERYDEEDILIDEEAMNRIKEFHSEEEPFVDAQFVPGPSSLYMDPADAEVWVCECRVKNPLPPVPDMPHTQEEVTRLNAELEAIKCNKCGAKPPHVAQSRFVHRPMHWLRPRAKCQICEVTLQSRFPNMKAKQLSEFVSRNCHHYLRDHIAETTVGAPWALIRGEARPEDVNQGAIGNCWFAGALSTIASQPRLIDRLFITKEFQPVGAYHLKLFRAGEWHGLIVDDLFPASKVKEQRSEGNMCYYAQGGKLSYLQCARRQLWVPLVEKAGAKMFASYAALNSGTFGEALSLFTGYPTERLDLYEHSERRRRRAEIRDERARARMQAMMQGQAPPPEPEEDEYDEATEEDIQWTKLLSACEAGYLMGLGCVAEAVEKTRGYVVEQMGLQSPHAYGILDVKELQVGDRWERLVKLRNPWGEKAPRTWKGDWGKDSAKWTPELQRKLQVINSSGVRMEDPNSIFWMSFGDVKQFFASVEICRIHPTWREVRGRCWLPSGVGPGEAFDLTVYKRTSFDFAFWQEKHAARESALGARSTNVDIGLAIMRAVGHGADGSPVYQCVEYMRRTMHDCSSLETALDGGYKYRLVPLCFNQMGAVAPRRAVLVVHSSSTVNLEKVTSDWSALAYAATGSCLREGASRPVQDCPGVNLAMLREGTCGIMAVCENTANESFYMQIDCEDALNCVSSTGSLTAVSVVPARSRQLLIALAPKVGAERYGPSFQSSPLPAEAAIAMGAEAWVRDDLHQPIAISDALSGPLPDPDSSILAAAPFEEDPAPVVDDSVPDDEDELAAAIAMSLRPDDAASPAVEEDDPDLAAALALSLAPPDANPPAALQQELVAAVSPSHSGEVGPAPAPVLDPEPKKQKGVLDTDEAKKLRKERFDHHLAAGMKHGAAAKQALADVKLHFSET
mmetsp:Transcript_87438/g.199787  ORF Transcript_87438/g.199787 Transcript_87438/m.199787 type:complete len:1041 (+) Transcript_87438:1-3123(+)